MMVFEVHYSTHGQFLKGNIGPIVIKNRFKQIRMRPFGIENKSGCRITIVR